jgi:NAD-dependent SIR2 family protein deacetylase
VKEQEKEIISKKIKDTVCVILAIGDRTHAKLEDVLADNEIYQAYKQAEEPLKEWITYACLLQALKSENSKAGQLVAVYNKLYEKFRFKNYFVICNNTDGIFTYSKFDEKKITTPWGSPWQLQCSHNCKDEVFDAYPVLEALYMKMESGLPLSQADIPVCPHCQQKLRFNIRKDKTDTLYCEQGYIKQWNTYRQWMQWTMNYETVLIELGESFAAPGVVRFPFERMTYLNPKAYLVRVNKSLWQIDADLKEKAIAIAQDEMMWIKEVTQ